jgi:nucleoside-diphosphate-sugar epimerase
MIMEIYGKRVFLTGGAGFIGTALTRRLVDKNQVVIYDNGHRGRLPEDLVGHPNIKYIKGDVLDDQCLKQAIEGSNYVIHLAAIAGVDTVLKMPVKTMKTSLIGTYNVLEAALAEKNLLRFIDFSTSEVFGTYAYKVQEGDPTSLGAVGEARWTYAVSKLASEHLSYNYFKEYGLPALSIRPFNIYGPGQIGEGAIHHFVVRALKGESLQIHNDGSQIRAWCYVDDIVDAVLLCLTKAEAIGQVFNIGNPRSTVTIHDLARHILRLSCSTSAVEFIKWNSADVELRIPSIEKARQLLDYEPKVDLEEGVQRTIDWYRERLSKSKA